MVIYDGPSMIDGNPIVAIVTLSSNNEKTGDIPQVWILRKDVAPFTATKTGEDFSVCGDCPLKPTNKNVCYVSVFMAPGHIYKSYLKGNYPVVSPQIASGVVAGKVVRIGAYGDPAAVPTVVWDSFLSKCKNTGYTHQWRTCDVSLQRYILASVHSVEEMNEANRLGWRTFRTGESVEDKLITEVICLADKHSTTRRKFTCKECKLCDGSRYGKSRNIFIPLHGIRKGNYGKTSLVVTNDRGN